MWKHFLRTKDHQKALCRVPDCNQKYNCGSSTSNLWRHVNSKHPERLEQVEERKRPAEVVIASPLPKITRHLMKEYSRDDILSRLACLDKFFFERIAKSESIRYLMESKGHKYPMTHSGIANIVNNVAVEKRLQYIEQFQRLQRNGTKFAISLDEWTSGAVKKYLCINLHAVNTEFWCLGLMRLEGSHPAIKLAEVTKKILDIFKLDKENIAGVTSDAAPVMNSLGKF